MLKETMAKNFPNLLKAVSLQILEAQGISNRINIKKTTQRYIIIKLVIQMIKRKFSKHLEVQRHIKHQGTKIRNGNIFLVRN